jgi:hypothetical protein
MERRELAVMAASGQWPERSGHRSAHVRHDPKPTFCSQSDAQTPATYLGPNLRSHSSRDQLGFSEGRAPWTSRHPDAAVSSADIYRLATGSQPTSNEGTGGLLGGLGGLLDKLQQGVFSEPVSM